MRIGRQAHHRPARPSWRHRGRLFDLSSEARTATKQIGATVRGDALPELNDITARAGAPLAPTKGGNGSVWQFVYRHSLSFRHPGG